MQLQGKKCSYHEILVSEQTSLIRIADDGLKEQGDLCHNLFAHEISHSGLYIKCLPLSVLCIFHVKVLRQKIYIIPSTGIGKS